MRPRRQNFAPAVGLNYVAFLSDADLTAQADTVLNDLANRNPNNIPVLSALAQVKLAHQDWVARTRSRTPFSRLGDKSDIADQINAAAFSGQKKFDDSLAALQNVYNANPGAVQPMAALVSVYLQSEAGGQS